MAKRIGKVYLCGAGPGDPGLITVKAKEAIEEADCLVYDLLANVTLLDYAGVKAEKIFVGKAGGRGTIAQKKINALLIEKALKGKTVVRLKGGDPFVFGRGGDEAVALSKAAIPFEIVPGVTSPAAVPAYAGIPITHPDIASSVAIISGHKDAVEARTKEGWRALATGVATVVFLMSRRNLSLITGKLIEAGKAPETPAALIESGTMTVQRTVTGTLETIAALSKKNKIKSPVMLVVGEVVGLREKLNWFETKPLFAKRILVTRATTQAGTFCDTLSRLGAEPVSMPTIKIVPPPDITKLDRAIKRVATYDWLLLTSVNGVAHFFERLKKLGLDVRQLKGVKICAIGPMTRRAIEAQNISVDITPKEFIAEAVLDALGKDGIEGKKFLLPRAMEAREIIPKEIKRLGGKIDVVTSYRTIAPRKDAASVREQLTKGLIDAVTFTSASTVKNFAKIIGKKDLKGLMVKTTVACIGPITAQAAEALGLKVDIMPRDYTIAGLTAEMEVFYKQ